MHGVLLAQPPPTSTEHCLVSSTDFWLEQGAARGPSVGGGGYSMVMEDEHEERGGNAAPPPRQGGRQGDPGDRPPGHGDSRQRQTVGSREGVDGSRDVDKERGMEGHRDRSGDRARRGRIEVREGGHRHDRSPAESRYSGEGRGGDRGRHVSRDERQAGGSNRETVRKKQVEHSRERSRGVSQDANAGDEGGKRHKDEKKSHKHHKERHLEDHKARKRRRQDDA